MSSSRRMPSRKAISEYWRDWTTERFDGVIDDGTCFACGLEDIAALNRAHIVARCNGGSDDVENLHLLCEDCHRLSEHIEGDDYFEWIAEWTAADRGIAVLARYGFPIHSGVLRHHENPQLMWFSLMNIPEYVSRNLRKRPENV